MNPTASMLRAVLARDPEAGRRWFSLTSYDAVRGHHTRIGVLIDTSDPGNIPVGASKTAPPGSGWVMVRDFEGQRRLGGYAPASIVVRHDEGTVTVEGQPCKHTRLLERVCAQATELPLVASEGVASAGPGSSPRVTHSPRVVWRHSDDDYLALIQNSISWARAQGSDAVLCLTNLARVKADRAFDALTVFEHLNAVTQAPCAALIVDGDTALVSASPETLLQVHGGVVMSSPMKGTRPRGDTPAADDQLRNELRFNEKERAENRAVTHNALAELATVCEPGSARISHEFRVQTTQQVHQLVSDIEGRLREDISLEALLDAVFPAASMIGVPKDAAHALLSELEQGARGLYSGCYGWVSEGGDTVHLAMSIRCAELQGSTAYLGAGGGITHASEPLSELAEVKLKARAVLGALRAGILDDCD